MKRIRTGCRLLLLALSLSISSAQAQNLADLDRSLTQAFQPLQQQWLGQMKGVKDTVVAHASFRFAIDSLGHAQTVQVVSYEQFDPAFVGQLTEAIERLTFEVTSDRLPMYTYTTQFSYYPPRRTSLRWSQLWPIYLSAAVGIIAGNLVVSLLD